MIDLNNPNRQDSLQAWLAYYRIAKKDLAQKIGVSQSMISKIIRGERAPAARLEQLVALGVPRELLPEPSGPPGRPRKGDKPPAKNEAHL